MTFTISNVGVEQERGRRRPQGMGTVEPRPFLDRSRQLFHVPGNDPIHAGLAHGLFAELIAVGRGPCPEERAGLEAGLFEVLGNRLGGGKMDPYGAVLVALFVDGQGRLFAVLVKVAYPQPAGGGEPDTGIEVGLQDGDLTPDQWVIVEALKPRLEGLDVGLDILFELRWAPRRAYFQHPLLP